ncbi:AMP-binding enzyme, partial [Glutamicibacter creatinolyticus]|uniref:AMP-binding enzyme n=1 Tax=Glutamicibacter creatinolyticus TaxID=162496 RepID=UPI003B9820C7
SLVAAAPDAATAARREAFMAELRETVRRQIGPIAKPRDVVLVPDVPKTRSGKIMRRLLTQLFQGTELGDTTSLQNESCIAQLEQICRHR